MANETETTASNSVTEEQQRIPVFPARPDDSSGINGADISAQYKAIHEAQLLHEETIRQIREELRSYKQKLTELAETSGAQRPGQMDGVLMRLSELERKIGEGAPDPLLNEIVHRLASLESAGGGRGGNDPRVEGLASQIENLRKQVADPPPSDPRTDDVVLRIAAVEGSLRRAQQELSADRIEDLERQVADDKSRVEEQFSQRLSTIEEEVSRTSRETGEATGERIAAVEQRIAEAIGEGSLTALTARLNEIEELVQQRPSAELPEAAGEQIATLERRLKELSDAAVLETDLASFQEKLQDLENQAADTSERERLEARLTTIESRVQEPAADQRVDELASRISTVEEKTAGIAGVEAAAIEDLLAKIKGIEQQLPQPEQRQELATRLSGLETLWEESQSNAPDLTAVIGRVEQLESHGAPAFESRIAELSGRLRTIEIKGESRSGDDQVVTRLAERLDQLELTGTSGDVARQLNELRERVAALAEQPQQSATDPQLEDKLQAALARVDALEEQPGGGDPRVEAFEKQLVSLRAEIGSLRLTAEQGVEAERVEALAAQIQELRDTAASAPQGGEEIDQLREKIEALGGSASDSALDGIWREMAVRIEELERQAESGLGASSDSSGSAELGQRLDRVESRLDEHADGGVASDVMERIVQRLDMVEHNVAQGVGTSAEGLSDSLGSEIASRFALIDRRLDEIGDSTAGGNANEALQEESERWNQWARSTLEEVGQLRRQVETLQEQGGAGEHGGASPQLLATLSEGITSALANSEVKAIQNHVFRLYFAIFLIIGMVLTFFMLNRS